MASVDTSSILPQLCNSAPYPCCYNEYMIESNKTCAECPLGTFGWNCKFPCQAGYYGRLCRLQCECCASQCNHVTGCNRDATILPNESLTRVSCTSRAISEGFSSSTVTTQHNPEFPLVYFLIGSILSFLILGCIIYILSRRKMSRLSFNVMKLLSNSCVDSDCSGRQHQDDVEMSTIHQSPQCGLEDEGMYNEIRSSRLIDGAGAAAGFCDTIVPYLAPKLVSGQVGPSSQRSNNYQQCMANGEYNHVHLRIKRSVRVLNSCRLASDSTEEYVVLKENRQVLPNPNEGEDDAGCQNPTLPRYTRKAFQQVDSRERNSDPPVSDGHLQINHANETNYTKKSLTKTDIQNAFLLDRQSSLIHGLSENELKK